ncbi:MAG: GSCFA domain-containing protein [Desulfomonilaceae bacterium]|nr:GSCFA domain-containing protein [Desulfomonilaceae bacterium]
MARSDVHPVHSFEPWQVWPGSYDNPPVDGTYPLPENPGLRIGRETLIASMGSCFAREIKTVLLREGFSYICEETDHPASKHASAAWERLYNTFSMRQIFEYTFENWSPEHRWWTAPESGITQDPYRRIILYGSRDEAEKDFQHHVECSRRALQRAEVLILTLGLTEIWEDRRDGSVICLPAGPYVNERGDMTRYRFRVSRYAENLANLERIHEIMRENNPGCDIVVTVSPVHLWATFRKDCDVISASCNSKSTLRAAVDEFAHAHQNVFYFPAYEMAAIYRPLMGRSVFTEGRENFHVNQETVNFIMHRFFEHYRREEYPLPSRFVDNSPD